MKNKILVIGDIHFGIKESERIYTELQQFLLYLKTHDINIVQLNGDFFDRTLNFAEPAGLYALQFWTDLLDICREKKIKIRCIEGTLSHDNFQVEALKEFINYDDLGNPDVDFKYFRTISTEDLNGMHILYVPEEYPKDPDEYYAEFKKDKYDLMFLHGSWDFTGLAKVADSTGHAPFFMYDDWKDSLEHGLCISGHYHGQLIYKSKKIVYPGSFSAWKFDYDNNRGFCYVEFDSDTKEYSYELIQNKLCPNFLSIKIDDLNLPEPRTASIDELKLAIDAKIKACDRFKIDLAGLDPNVSLILVRAYKNMKNIHVDDSSKKLINESVTIDENKTSTVNSEYAFVLENSLPKPKIISKFIKTKYNKIITEEEIEAVVTKDVDVNKFIESRSSANGVQ